VAEDGGGRLFFHCQTVLRFVENVGNSNFLLFYGLYKPQKQKNLLLFYGNRKREILNNLRFVQTQRLQILNVLLFV